MVRTECFAHRDALLAMKVRVDHDYPPVPGQNAAERGSPAGTGAPGTSGMIMSVAVRLLYLMMVRVLGWLGPSRFSQQQRRWANFTGLPFA